MPKVVPRAAVGYAQQLKSLRHKSRPLLAVWLWYIEWKMLVLRFTSNYNHSCITKYSRVWNKRSGTFINFQTFFQGAWNLFQIKGLNFVRKSAFFWMK